ncbi:MAG: dephospho-CoA kinase [Opitutaceae bacterium]|nr:dephospho-CoA kinase [Opitutaceae bacterium]MBP8961502.1 dephospho-CoA kinase [Opitutaceae bacterium]
MIFGLTGGMGCGKSTAGRLFAELGWRRIDCDALVRDVVLRDPAVVAQIGARFGQGVLAADGQIERARLAEAVFGDDAARLWLEALVHPEVRRHWAGQVQSAPQAMWVVEVPLLFEKNLEKMFDFTVCVACAPDLQLTRLEQRGIERTFALQRISKQLPLARKIELSDFVLSNDGTLDFLRDQVRQLMLRYPAAV